ncbi:hypothetical protein SAMN05216188_1011052 [Lentzea xinjiangensis]|uniref:Uncharacterized protein n=1 Tax=Lentzea xinjiangensis TaxID=402600 RepID=A0A1H9C5V6_9PSEU|nr:hypothetical protein SAMN05216188_1011052 [Lentzea xinjiangensis]
MPRGRSAATSGWHCSAGTPVRWNLPLVVGVLVAMTAAIPVAHAPSGQP